jgi:hypothetical protein
MKKLLTLTLAMFLLAGLLPITAIPAAAVTMAPGVTVLVDTILDYDHVGPFSDGLAPVRVGDWGMGQCGYINQFGELVIPLKYNYAEPFSDGLAWVEAHDAHYGRRWNLIDKTGDVVVSFPVSRPKISPFLGGMFSFHDLIGFNGINGLINKNGDVFFEFEQGVAFPIGDGLAVVNTNGKTGVVNLSGDYVIEPFSGEFIGYYGGQLLFASDNGVLSIYNRNGELIRTLNVGYKIVDSFENDTLIIRDESSGMVGLYDLTTNTAKFFPEFGVIGGYREVGYNGLMIAKTPNKDNCYCECHCSCGCHHWNWNDVHSCSACRDGYIGNCWRGYADGCALRCDCPNNGADCISEWQMYLIDKTGKIIFDHIFDHFDLNKNGYEELRVINEWGMNCGFVTVRKNGQAALFNIKGELIVPFGIYDDFNTGTNGLISVRGNNGKWGILQIGSPGVTVTGSVPGTSINLSTEAITLPATFAVAAFSTDGGKKWKRGELPNAARFPRLLNKGMTLHVTSDFDRKGKKPAADAQTITFPKIDARPKRNADKLKPFYGDENWVLAKKGSTAAVFAGLEYAPSSNGKTPDDNWLPLPQEGLPVLDSRATILVRTAPTAARAASTAWRVRPAVFGKAPNYKAKNGEISIRANTYVSLPDGTVTLHREKKKIPVVSGMEVWNAATGRKPAGLRQTLT